MRQVDLGPVEGLATAQELALAERKTRHLAARMEEFLPDGMKVSCEGPTEAGWGAVKIRVPGLDSNRGREVLLRQYGIRSCPVGEDGMICFLVSNRASFEDMDYVQAAVTELFDLDK